MIKTPSQTFLLNILNYDPDTGMFYWRQRDYAMFPSRNSCDSWNTRYANKPAFTAIGDDGYFRGAINYISYRAHRIAWKIYYGDEPNFIDHINGCRTDNRISNLRSVTKAENARNSAIPVTNSSGVIGVHFCNERRKYVSQIRKDGKSVYLGRFETFDEAVEARRAAEIRLGFHENHGRAV